MSTHVAKGATEIPRHPCGTCPYRRDVPVGTWHRDEFVAVLDNDHAWGRPFHCHGRPEQFCGGWLLDQKRRGLPCVPLRIALLHADDAAERLDALDDAGLSLYDSVEEMCAANGVNR